MDECRLVDRPVWGVRAHARRRSTWRGAADRAQDLALQTRTVLAHHISWIPFIDAAVVTAGDRPAEPAVSTIVVPVDLLGELLMEGPPVIDQPALAVHAGVAGRREPARAGGSDRLPQMSGLTCASLNPTRLAARTSEPGPLHRSRPTGRPRSGTGARA